MVDERISPESRRLGRARHSQTHSQKSDDPVTLRGRHTTSRASRTELRVGCKAGSVVSIALLLILLLASFVGSQSLDVVLRGKVSDETGAGLPGATVTAIDEATGVLRSAGADREGSFVLLNLQPSTYNVRADLDGFSPNVRRAQVLHVGTTVVINFSLEIAIVTEHIEVPGTLPALETSQNTVARIVQTDEIDALPVINRNFNDLAALAPGVTKTGVYGGVDINGSRDFQNAYQVDGVSAERQRLGDQQIPFAQDWIQEFQVMTTQFNPEFGQAAGGVLNAITRSGGNQIAGRIYGFLRNDAWDATPALVTRKPPLMEHRIGGTCPGNPRWRCPSAKDDGCSSSTMIPSSSSWPGFSFHNWASMSQRQVAPPTRSSLRERIGRTSSSATSSCMAPMGSSCVFRFAGTRTWQTCRWCSSRGSMGRGPTRIWRGVLAPVRWSSGHQISKKWLP